MFHDLLALSESHELFLKSLHGTTTPPVAFHSDLKQPRNTTSHGRIDNRQSRGGASGGRGLATTTEIDLANAFHAQCHVNSSGPDWYVDSGATDHMTSSPENVNNATPNIGQANVTFGNGNKLHVSHTMVNNNIRLLDVLVVPNLTKNLLSISKLTSDNRLDVLFS
ncbi:hypothetical protein Tco_0435225 [Tanacetum coccineum]